MGSEGDTLDPSAISALLTTRCYGRSLDVRDETDSTNDDAREAAAAGAPRGHVVLADAQRRGRGGHGRAWSSPPGTDVYLSIVERLPLAAERIAPLTLAVGLGVAESVEALAPQLEARVKWPNDVWVGGRKCAGILVEGSSFGPRMETLVIGIGLDVNRTRWEGDLAHGATSIRSASGRVVERARAVATLLGCVEAWVDRFVALGTSPVIAALEARLALRGERVRIDETEGVLLGVAPNGAARRATGVGVREIASGTLRPA